jgi:hypothetical protein
MCAAALELPKDNDDLAITVETASPAVCFKNLRRDEVFIVQSFMLLPTFSN